MTNDGFHHRSGSQKQSNKQHKTGGHSTKRSLDKAAHGRVEKAVGSAPGRKVKLSLSEFSVVRKADKLNHVKQFNEKRREQLALEKRMSGGFGAPKVVTVVGLARHARAESVVAQILAHADSAFVEDSFIPNSDAVSAVLNDCQTPIGAIYTQFRQRFLITAPPRPGQKKAGSDSEAPFVYDVNHTLASVYASDILIVIADMSHGDEACVDAEGDLFLTALRATGVPSCIGVITGLDVHPQKKWTDLKKYATRMFNTEFGEDNIRVVDSPTDPYRNLLNSLRKSKEGDLSFEELSETVIVSHKQSYDAATVGGSALNIVRTIASILPKSIGWRSNRSYLTSMSSSYTATSAGEKEAEGELSVTGYLRGRPLNVHQLICLPGVGVYQIEKISRPIKDNFLSLRRISAKNEEARLSMTGRSITLRSLLPQDTSSSYEMSNNALPYETLLSRLNPFSHRIQPASNLKLETTGVQGVSTSGEPELLAVPSPEFQESTETLGALDELANEQTWPEEGPEARSAGSGGRIRSRNAGGANATEHGFSNDLVYFDGSTANSNVPADDSDLEDDGELDEEEYRRLYENVDNFAATHGLDPNAPDYAEVKRKSEEALAAQRFHEREKRKTRRLNQLLKRRGLQDDTGYEGNDAEDVDEDDMDDETVNFTQGPGATLPVDDRKRNRLLTRLEDSKNQELFPDEVDTPLDVPARERFVRYRGLKSFRSSPWDPKETLPPAYGRVFTIPNFIRTQRRIAGEGALAQRALYSIEGQRMSKERLIKKLVAKSKHNPHILDDLLGDDEEDEQMDEDEDDEMDDGKKEKKRDNHEDARTIIAKSVMNQTIMPDGTPIYEDLQAALGAGWIESGELITITIKKVPTSSITTGLVDGLPVSIYSLLRHENRTSVMQINLQRVPEYQNIIRSKDNLEFRAGCRVFDARPLFSMGSGLDPKSKLERYLLPGRACTATVYAPVCFSPCPVLVFKRVRLDSNNNPINDDSTTLEHHSLIHAPVRAPATASGSSASSNGARTEAEENMEIYPLPDRINQVAAMQYRTRLILVATGTVNCANPDRCIIKRTLLTGFPLKVKKRFAMVAHMFFNPEDVNYFKPIELFTKNGLVGNITASVGTHGRMKCYFDKVINQNDTVCMSLYKRVFPRWGYCYRTLLPDNDTGGHRSSQFAFNEQYDADDNDL